MFKTVFIVMLYLCNICNAAQFLNEIEIAGKIVDQDGNLIMDEVTLTVELKIVTYPDVLVPKISFPEQIITDTETLEKKVRGGIFSWKLPDANTCAIRASKEDYHDDYIRNIPSADDKIIVKDLILHLVKKGTPSKLEYVEGAIIPSKKNKKSGGKDCGWSFKKLWYFPVDEEETIWMTKTIDEEGRAVYTMKEPGGFVYFAGFPQRESAPDKLYAWLEWMPQAPEDGYVQSVCPESTSGYCYYFKTPDGKYGKIAFEWDFDYYLQPDGSRNLEAGEVKTVGPVRPGYKEWIDKWSR